jgi:hypothetical protein
VCFGLLFRKLASGFDAQQCTAEWLNSFSPQSYAPMERLLDRGDVAFLATQPGYRPEIGKRLMLERRRLFRSYLRMLVRDFNQLIGIGKLMVVYSDQDQQEFARSLGRQQLKFYAAVCALHVQLALYPLGWPAVDARGLVAAVGVMGARVREIAAAGGGGPLRQMA